MRCSDAIVRQDEPVLHPPAGTSLAGLERLEHTATGATLELVRAWPGRHRDLVLELRGSDGELVAARWSQERGTRGPAAVARDGRLVRLHEQGQDRRLPGLTSLVARHGAQLLVHRAGRRGVVRLADGTYAKAVRPERLRSLVTATSRTAALAGRFSVPEPVEVDAPRGILRSAALPGVALHDRLGDPAAAAAAGVALRSLHDCATPAGLRVHRAAAEADVVERWIARLSGALVGLPDGPPDTSPAGAAARRAAALASRVHGALLRGSQHATPVPVHRDLHDKQILVDGDRVGLLDFDTLASGEPALDLANLLVHIELRALQDRCSVHTARSTCDAVLAAYRPDDAVLLRLAPYAAATWLRLACVYAFRPARPGLLEDLLDRAHASC